MTFGGSGLQQQRCRLLLSLQPWISGIPSGFVSPEKDDLHSNEQHRQVTSYQISGLFANGSLVFVKVWSFEVVHLENVEEFISEGANILSYLKDDDHQL